MLEIDSIVKIFLPQDVNLAEISSNETKYVTHSTLLPCNIPMTLLARPTNGAPELLAYVLMLTSMLEKLYP